MPVQKYGLDGPLCRPTRPRDVGSTPGLSELRAVDSSFDKAAPTALANASSLARFELRTCVVRAPCSLAQAVQVACCLLGRAAAPTSVPTPLATWLTV